MKISANERIPKPANILGIYFDLKNKYENIIMSSPRNTIGIEAMAVCELKIIPMGNCNCSYVNEDKCASLFIMCKAIKGTSTVTAIRVASTNFKDSASNAKFLFTVLSII